MQHNILKLNNIILYLLLSLRYNACTGTIVPTRSTHLRDRFVFTTFVVENNDRGHSTPCMHLCKKQKNLTNVRAYALPKVWHASTSPWWPCYFIQAAVLLTLFTLSKCTTLTIVSICRVSAWFFSLSLSSSDVACLVLTRHRSVLSSSLQPTLQQRQINTFSLLFYTKNGMTEFDFQK